MKEALIQNLKNGVLLFIQIGDRNGPKGIHKNILMILVTYLIS